MLDIKRIRADAEAVKTAMRNRNKPMDDKIDEILKIDEERRAISTQTDELKAKQNKVSKLIPQYKKEGKDVTEIFAEMKEISDKIKADDQKIAELEDRQRSILLEIPNIPHESVPVGKDDSDNIEVRRNGEVREFPFEPKAHWDIGAAL